MTRRLGIPLSLLFALVLVIGCSVGAPQQSADPAVEPDSIDQESVQVHFSLVQITFERLVAFFVDRPNTVDLMTSAWQGALAAAQEHGVNPSVTAPIFSGDALSDLRELRTSFRELTRQSASKIDPIELSFRTAEAMVQSLNDNHTYFMRPPQWRAYRGSSSGSGGESNVGLVPIIVDGLVIVSEVVANGPGAKANVQAGDRIIALDGETLPSNRNLQLASLSALLGAEGSTMKLTLEREGRGQFDVAVVRAPSANPLLEVRLLPGRVGYLRVRSFPSSIARLTDNGVFSNLVDGALGGLQHEGATGWIIDLRNNSGGDVRAASQLTGRFTRSGPYAFTVSRFSRNVQVLEGPLIAGADSVVVLVNEGSYSAAELSAAVMQEYKSARVIGTKSPGIVDGAQTFDLADGAGVSVTTARILTGQGRRSLEGVGVTPDQIVPITRADLAAGRDPQLDAALAYVRSQLGQ